MKQHFMAVALFFFSLALLSQYLTGAVYPQNSSQEVPREVYRRILRCKMCHSRQYEKLEKDYPKKKFMCLECHGWAKEHPVKEKKGNLPRWSVVKKPTYETCLNQCHNDHKKKFSELEESEGRRIFEEYRKSEMMASKEEKKK